MGKVIHIGEFIPVVEITFPSQINLLSASGIRLLVPGYTGDAILLQRDSDDAELAFGFDGKFVDYPATQTWLAGSKGHVKTIFDQTGNGYHQTQSNKVDMGYIDLDPNGNPTIRMNDRLETGVKYLSTIPTHTQTLSVFCVASTLMAKFFDGSTGNEMFMFNGGNPPTSQVTDGLSFRSSTLKTANNECSMAVSAYSSNPSRLRLIKDELDETLANFTVTTFDNITAQLGEQINGANGMVGVFSEELIYSVGVDDTVFDEIVSEQSETYSIPTRTHFVVSLGDSNTYGHPVARPLNSNVFESWPGLLSIKAGDVWKVRNDGFNAFTFNDYDVANFEDRYIEQLLQTSLIPIVAIMLGGNDISLGDSHATVTGQLDAMKADILGRAPDCNIVVITIISRQVYLDTPALETVRLSFNQYIRDNFDDAVNNLYVVDLDLNPNIGGDDAHLDLTYFENDDTHLNVAGQQQVANDVFAVIDNI